MHQTRPQYHGYRFPPEIIVHAVWLYHRFCLSFCDVEDLLRREQTLEIQNSAAIYDPNATLDKFNIYFYMQCRTGKDSGFIGQSSCARHLVKGLLFFTVLGILDG